MYSKLQQFVCSNQKRIRIVSILSLVVFDALLWSDSGLRGGMYDVVRTLSKGSYLRAIVYFVSWFTVMIGEALLWIFDR